MLSRLALRLAAVECLAPVALAATGPWRTIAGPRVFDSRQDPLDLLDEAEARPLVVVYTDQTEAVPYTGAARPDAITCDLTCEILLATRGTVQAEQPDGTVATIGTLDTPLMEREHEALIDLLEAQVRRRLEGRTEVDAQTELFRQVAKSVRQISSVPVRDETRTLRFAARAVTFRCEIAADRWPEPSTAPAAATGLDRLPEPLRAVAKALPAGSSAKAACETLAGLVANPTALPALDLTTLFVGMGRQPTDLVFDAKGSV